MDDRTLDTFNIPSQHSDQRVLFANLNANSAISLRISVTPPELELIASEQLVEIIPLITMERTAFISGAYGPLRPPSKCKVPIWMATNLKLKKKCHIVAPEWLNVGMERLLAGTLAGRNNAAGVQQASIPLRGSGQNSP
ncbi:hypothetical protein EW146_g6605 [Bondarzewia mesenterica]|uniref:DNA replication complex GINS protein PSF2 n=1 Tax=Bondarzewia mesenterica TaxID=1095465 RepID=A0A4S4LN32_9AGAM|nr:hypothetical protein EW146_g6605 [Bondarzewia mesenterica]